MSAPLLSLTAPKSGLEHRYAAVVADGVDDVIALCVRRDDDDHKKGDSLLLRLRPGRADVVATLPFVARAVSRAGHDERRFLVVDAADSLFVVVAGVGAPTLLRSGVRDLKDGVVLGADGSIARVVDDDEGRVVLAPRGSVAGAVVVGTTTTPGTILLGCADGSVVEIEDVVVDVGTAKERWRAAATDTSSDGGPVDAVALVDGVVAIAAGRCLQVGPARHVLVQPANALACVGDRWFIGTSAGLFVVDEGRVMPLRPSLRAHHLVAVRDGLVVVSDLFVAGSDGVDFAVRDLSAFIRVAGTAAP
ncbi:MAG TPA: hypothetical protein VGF99_15605 [Myxococcota bacterium]